MSNNKYLFKLLSIFGFSDESLLSLFDKDQMKVQYMKAWKKQKHKRESFLEEFLICYSIKRLSKLREHLNIKDDFRKLLLYTNTDILWNTNLMNDKNFIKNMPLEGT